MLKTAKKFHRKKIKKNFASVKMKLKKKVWRLEKKKSLTTKKIYINHCLLGNLP
jgi:hypothetical protein